jgi:hypothetical protein
MISMKKIVAGLAGTGAAFALTAGSVFAQDPINVSLGSATALNDATVEIELVFEGNGESSGFGADINYDVPGIADIDLSNCLEGSNTALPSCVHPGGGDHTSGVIRLALFQDASVALSSFTGTLVFELDGTLSAGDVINIFWDEATFDANNPEADVNSSNGQIDIIDVPPEELSELSVSPDPLDFGTVDLGNMPQTGVITATNSGGSESSLTISSADYSGDGEFTAIADGCSGTTLAAGESCDVTIEFDASSDGSFNGSLAFSSDADANANPTVSITGAADSVANLEINPPSGPVNLGSGFQGDTLSASATISNNGSADGSFTCDLDDPSGVFSASPLSGDVGAGGSASVSLSCSLPSDAEDGDSFSATFSCSGSEGFSSEHELSCTVSEFEPVPVPTMQKWSLILFALMMLIAGGIGIRFFRA